MSVTENLSNQNQVVDPIEIYVETTLKELEKIVNGQDITPVNILLFALNIEQIVERYKDLKGPQKKQLVIKVFEKYMESHNGDKYGALAFLPNFIDVTISLDRKDVTISLDVEKITTGCCAMFVGPKKKN